jgi:CRP-like cAMP-binding protein/Zn-dependent protease
MARLRCCRPVPEDAPVAGDGALSVYDAIAARLPPAPPNERARLWDDLAERVDVAEFRPELAPDVEIKTFLLRWGNDYTIIANPRDLIHLRLETGESDLLPLMDGTRSVKEIVVDRFEESGDLELSGVADLVQELRQGNFLTVPFVDVNAAIEGRLERAPTVVRAVRNFVRTLTIEWAGAQGLVRALYDGGLKWVFNRWVAIVLGLIAPIGFVAFWALYRSGTYTLTGRSAAVESLIILAMNYALTFMHELAHALVLIRHGRRVKSAGFMIYFGSPAFFVDASDGLLMDRHDRIVQSLAGPYAELVIAGGASIVAFVWPEAAVSGLLYRFALLNYFVIFLNLVPLLELDGYWILSDAIQVPDLRPRSLAFIRFDLWRKLRRREGFTKQEVGLGLYGTLGVAFTILAFVTSAFFWREVFGGLVSELWSAGAVGRVLLVALVVFVTGPLLRGALAFARSLLRALGRLVGRVRFRLERSWRVEAAHLIDDVAIFDDLPESVLSDLAGRVRLRRVPTGKPIVRQGDRADAFFVVRAGTFEIVEEHEGGDERVLRVLGRGESFGEVGLAMSAPRAATVRALSHGQLFEIDESTFDRLLADSVHLPEFGPTIQKVTELRALPAFETLEPDEAAELLAHGEWMTLPPGEPIVTQGEAGDAFYALAAGQVDVFEDDRYVRSLGPGAHFGELALLHDVPRTATVVTKTPVRAFRLDRNGFDRLLASAFRKGTVKPSFGADRTWHH